jgi:uncharacterized oligopeptide transporter (OPT) family protein
VGPTKSRELTWQAALSAVIVSALVSASYPYVILKLGIGPNVSVVSAFLGALMLLILAPRTVGQNRLMNNIVQTAGTSAASISFMCVVAAAVDLAAANPTMTDTALNGIRHIEPWPMFWWLCCSGGMGVLFIVLFRRHFVEDPKLVFADGVAAAETILVLDDRGPEAGGKFKLLGLAALASAVVDLLREGLTVFREGLAYLPDFFFGSRSAASLRVGTEWNLLSLGSGMLIGLVVSLSMLAATLLVLFTGPNLLEAGIGRDIVLNGVAAEHRAQAARFIDKPWSGLSKEEQTFIKEHGNHQAAYMQGRYFSILLLWYMWPATALMIASSITAVLLKWRTVVATFRQLQIAGREGKSEDVSLTTIIVGGLICTVALAIVQRINFGMSILQTAVAVICTLPLILVSVRVFGETNFSPISVMMNGLQAIFAVFWQSNVGHNLIAAGMTGTGASQGGGTIQDYKTGQIIGSTPRLLTWVQLAAVPIGAAAVSIMYPILTQRYRLGEDLTTPTGVKIANMAMLLAQGFDALPRGVLFWTIMAAVVGIGLTVVNHFLQSEWMPSAGGFGLGLILPGTLTVPMAIGGITGYVWMRSHRPSYDRYMVTLASGFIAGEALLGGLILPIIAALR